MSEVDTSVGNVAVQVENAAVTAGSAVVVEVKNAETAVAPVVTSVVATVESVTTGATQAVVTEVKTAEAVAAKVETATVTETKAVVKTSVEDLSKAASAVVEEVNTAQKNLDLAKTKAAGVLTELETSVNNERKRVQEELASWMDKTTTEINKVVAVVRKLPEEVVAEVKAIEVDMKEEAVVVESAVKKNLALVIVSLLALLETAALITLFVR